MPRRYQDQSSLINFLSSLAARISDVSRRKGHRHDQEEVRERDSEPGSRDGADAAREGTPDPVEQERSSYQQDF